MDDEYLKKMSDLTEKLQQPLHDFAALNVKTLQSMEFVSPEDLSKVQQPDELFEKQIALAISNGHKALDYMQQSFQIFERAMLSLLPESQAKKNVK